MIVSLSEVRKKDYSKCIMLYRLINQGKIKGYTIDGQHIAYDTKEYENYKKGQHRGRPTKLKLKGR